MLDGYYSIGEVAHLTGLSVKAIRHYANENLVEPSTRSDVGYRLYNPNDVWRLTLVRLLRELEFSLPQIQKILLRSPDVASVLQWQKNVLDLQIEHLKNVRSRIDQIPADTWGTSSLAHLQIVLEAMNMSTEQKQDWLLERWSQALIPEGAPSDWKVAFLQELKGFLPTEWDQEQTKAWTELQELLNDSKYRDELQQAVQPFWQMMQQ